MSIMDVDTMIHTDYGGLLTWNPATYPRVPCSLAQQDIQVFPIYLRYRLWIQYPGEDMGWTRLIYSFTL